MENSIRSFTDALASFCNHLQSTCDAFKQSLERRPIPLDSASSTFVQSINRRVSSASFDLNFLDSMSFGTVSFEELLGHCNEVYKKNQNDMSEIEDRLRAFGYHTEPDIDECDDDPGSTPSGFESKLQVPEEESDPTLPSAGSVVKSLVEDTVFDDSLNLQSLGLSEACLATLASNANGDADSSMREEPLKHFGLRQSAAETFEHVPRSVISISKDDYECLPSYLRSLSSWEDLLTAVGKMNSSLIMEGKGKGSSFNQDDLLSLDLGAKERTYLLLLVRINCLAVETVDGKILYRVL